MNIGFDAKRIFQNFTGLGNYSRTLVENLLKYHPDYKYKLFSSHVPHHPFNEVFQHSNNCQIISPPPALPFKSWWRRRNLIKNPLFQNLSVFHGLTNEIPIGIKKTNIPSVVTIHDLIFKEYPQQYPAIDRYFYNQKSRKACEEADRIIAISEATKSDIVKYYQIHPDKISVIYQDCSPIFKTPPSEEYLQFAIQQFDLPQNFILYVGSVIERKNLLTIVKALKILPKSLQIPLVVVGQGKSYEKKVKKFIQHNHLNHLVQWRQIPYNHLPPAYQLAEMFLYPSHKEGFGIPVIEALSIGTPVITSNTSSLVEAGGEAALQIPPTDVEALSQGIELILTNIQLQNKMVSIGKNHVKKFDGEKVTRELVQLYREISKD
jgi:glycosyltransferase involved in cell wall biosynthesis